MGCVNTKIQKTDQEITSKDNDLNLTENNLDNLFNNTSDEVVDYYDLPYNGNDEIL